MRIRIGTRQSQLARWQANYIAEQLTGLGAQIEMVPITTKGDVATQPLGAIGGQGLFTKEIQRALLDGRCDLAVHSLKDLPTDHVDGISLCAVPQRESVGDCLIGRTAATIAELPHGSIVGTGSLRRIAQLLRLRPDLKVVDIRGNVDSRIRKLDEGQYDAIVLAAAGLRRLGFDHRVTQWFSMDEMMPAIGQAALGLEARDDDQAVRDFTAQLSDPKTWASVLAERSLLRMLRAGCLAPVAGNAHVVEGNLFLKGAVYSTDGTRCIFTSVAGTQAKPEELGKVAANQLRIGGASELIEIARR